MRHRRPVRAALLAAVAVVGAACSGDEGRTAPQPALTTTAPPEPAPCIDVPDIEGTTAAPVCSLGFGIALPDGWDATRLDDDALERLSNVDLSRPSFYDAAVNVASTGAVFYAAGVDAEGRVSDLKIDVESGADTSADGVLATARAVVDGGELDRAELVDDDDGPVRVDYRLASADAESGEDLDVHGSRLFVPDGDRLWSLIVTSEDAGTLVALVELFGSTIRFD